jgi:hypothetical protein
MFRILESTSSTERIAGAAEFIRSFPPATELLIIGVSRDAPDDFVCGLARSAGATFGLHRFSTTQFAARLAIGKLAAAGVAPTPAVGAEALAVRAACDTRSPVRGAMSAIGRASIWKQKTDATPISAGFVSHAGASFK